jgi:hypothetical protein
MTGMEFDQFFETATGLPSLTEEQRALVAELVADGLCIQHKFRPEPLYNQTGKGYYVGSTVEEIRQAKERRDEEDRRA